MSKKNSDVTFDTSNTISFSDIFPRLGKIRFNIRKESLKVDFSY